MAGKSSMLNIPDRRAATIRSTTTTRAAALVESLVDQILRIYPEDRLPIGRAELARRIRMVFESVREGDPRPYPEIEREGI